MLLLVYENQDMSVFIIVCYYVSIVSINWIKSVDCILCCLLVVQTAEIMGLCYRLGGTVLNPKNYFHNQP